MHIWIIHGTQKTRVKKIRWTQVDMAKRAGRVWSIELWVKRVIGQKRVILSGLKMGSG